MQGSVNEYFSYNSEKKGPETKTSDTESRISATVITTCPSLLFVAVMKY